MIERPKNDKSRNSPPLIYAMALFASVACRENSSGKDSIATANELFHIKRAKFCLFCSAFTMEALLNIPKTIRGNDGILRCSKELGPLPKVDCSFAQYLVQKLERNVEEGKDCTFLVDGSAGIPKICIVSFLLNLLEMNGDERKGLTISHFLSQTKKFAKSLHHIFKIKKGDIVAFYIDNCLEYPSILLAAWLNQAIVSAGDFSLSERVLSLQLEEMLPKVVVCANENLDRITKTLEAIGLTNTKIVVVDAIEDFSNRHKSVYPLNEFGDKASDLEDLPKHLNDKFEPEDVLVILWSSGKLIVLCSPSLSI